MTYLRFGIRDLLWAMVVMAFAVGWAADRYRRPDNVSMFINDTTIVNGLSPGDKVELEVMRDESISKRIVRSKR